MPPFRIRGPGEAYEEKLDEMTKNRVTYLVQGAPRGDEQRMAVQQQQSQQLISNFGGWTGRRRPGSVHLNFQGRHRRQLGQNVPHRQ